MPGIALSLLFLSFFFACLVHSAFGARRTDASELARITARSYGKHT